MSGRFLSLLALLPLLPLTAAGQAQPPSQPAAAEQRADNLGNVLRRLTEAEPDQVSALLDSMPDINAATPGENITAVHAAIAYNRQDVLLQLLQRGARTDLLMKPGLTPLSAAAMKNDTDAISLLLRFGAQLNHHTRGGVSALKLACAKGNLDAAQVLLAHGADPLPADSEGHTALSLAQEHAGENRVPLMRMLLEHGADPNSISGEENFTPLITAIFSRDVECARLLLEHGAQADCSTTRGSTPLMIAAGYGFVDLTRQLLKRGASLQRQDEDGNDALDHAAMPAHYAHGLIAFLAGENQDMQLEARVDSRATCELLLGNGANVHHTDASGSTALIIAARVCEPEHIRLLLAHGADANARDHAGHTPLISALLPLKEKVRLAFLLKEEETDQRTFEHLTRMLRKHARTEQTIRLLLEAGADPTLRDDSGRSALDYATPELRALLQPAAPAEAPQP